MTNLNFKTMSDQDLILKMKELATEDRNLQVLFLKHLKEVEVRKLFLEIGYSSLFEYVVKDLGYSESTAYRRIEAARLLNEEPEIEHKIKSGVISLNTAAQVQTYFKKIKRQSGVKVSISKSELISELENKTSREVERHLLSMTPSSLIPNEKIRLITPDHVELKIILTEEQRLRLEQLKLLLSHINPAMNYQELIDHVCKMALKQLDPSLKITKKNNSTDELCDKKNCNIINDDNACSASPKNNNFPKLKRYIPSTLKSKIHQRDQGCCTYINPKTQQKCGSRFQLQIDHIHPFALRGSNEESNLRLLCSSHNRYRSEKTFGKSNRFQR